MRARPPFEPMRLGPAARIAAVLGVFLCAVAPSPARAADEAPEAGDAEARRLFGEGSRLYLAGRYDEALSALEASYKLVPSPNSGLLIARCLRELRRPVESAQMFASVESEARRRVHEGDARYAPTADAAATEGARVRAGLGRLHVRVHHAPPGTRLTVDGAPVAMTSDQEVVVLHPAGDATVRLTPPEGAEQSQSVSVGAGAEVKMEFELAPRGSTPPPPPPPGPGEPPAPAPSDAASSIYVPAAWISGGVALTGLGFFTGFGLASRSKFDDLQNRCGQTGCGPADRAEADAGKRDQTIANVGLVVGLLGAAATGVFVVLAVTDHHDGSNRTTELRVGPGSAHVRVAF